MQDLTKIFEALWKMNPAPFNPDYNPAYVARSNELSKQLDAYRETHTRNESIRMQAKLYTELYGAEYEGGMKARYPEAFNNEEN